MEGVNKSIFIHLWMKGRTRQQRNKGRKINKKVVGWKDRDKREGDKREREKRREKSAGEDKDSIAFSIISGY